MHRNLLAEEMQFQEIPLQEYLRDNRSKIPKLLKAFESDLQTDGVLPALNAVTARLSPYEAVSLALTALSNAALGAKLGLTIIHEAQKVQMTEHVLTILGTIPLPDDS